jgi:hypothetical protein
MLVTLYFFQSGELQKRFVCFKLIKTEKIPTTSFLTATNLIYATGAGITAAAGTRLALQLILIKIFVFNSFQIAVQVYGGDISCHYLLYSRLGNLRACCLP